MNRPLIEYLPSFMQKSKIYQAIFGAGEPELTELETAIDDLEKQLNIDTATWALEIYEKDLGIKTDENKPLAERRSLIKSKERGTGKVGAELIKTVVAVYTNGGVGVAFDGHIIVIFNDVYGIPPNMQDVYDALSEIIPAHLDLDYVFLYRTYGDLTAYTHSFLSNHTHFAIREGEI